MECLFSTDGSQQLSAVLTPSAALASMARNTWRNVDWPEPALELLSAIVQRSTLHFSGPVSAIRLGRATFAFASAERRAAVTTKFHWLKTPDHAQQAALREYQLTVIARSLSRSAAAQATIPLAAARGVSVFRHTDGFTLDQIISKYIYTNNLALNCVRQAAGYLASLHRQPLTFTAPARGEQSIAYGARLVEQLSSPNNPLMRTPERSRNLLQLLEIVGRKAEIANSADRAFIHGDATVANFIFSSPNRLTAIDWERAGAGDPAADLGRFLAEISHSIRHHGGTAEEACVFCHAAIASYLEQAGAEAKSMCRSRVRFHRAVSLLRIARNPWELWRMKLDLIEQAEQLLQHPD